MTGVKQRAFILVAAFVLAIGCAFALAMPQQDAYAATTKLKAGSTQGTATNLELKGTELTAANKTQFYTNNNWYKFNTSDRDSQYKITIRSYEGYRIYCMLEDAAGNVFCEWNTTNTKGQSWVLKNLTRNTTYYIHAFRMVTDPAAIIASGNVIDAGISPSTYPQYKITVKEQLNKPTVTGFWATSLKKKTLNVFWDEPSFNTDKIQIQFYWGWQKKKKANTWNRYSSSESYKTKVKYRGAKKPYKVRIRPYMLVNGKKVYGAWTPWQEVIVK